jgi:hypothetical protein
MVLAKLLNIKDSGRRHILQKYKTIYDGFKG